MSEPGSDLQEITIDAAEEGKVTDLVRAIDLKDTTSVIHFGANAQEDVTAVSSHVSE